MIIYFSRRLNENQFESTSKKIGKTFEQEGNVNKSLIVKIFLHSNEFQDLHNVVE